MNGDSELSEWERKRRKPAIDSQTKAGIAKRQQLAAKVGQIGTNIETESLFSPFNRFPDSGDTFGPAWPDETTSSLSGEPCPHLVASRTL